MRAGTSEKQAEAGEGEGLQSHLNISQEKAGVVREPGLRSKDRETQLGCHGMPLQS